MMQSYGWHDSVEAVRERWFGHIQLLRVLPALALGSMQAGRTALLLAHEASALPPVDRVLRLVEGRFVAV